MNYTRVEENQFAPELIGTVDPDPHLGEMTIVREGIVSAEVGPRSFYWNIGRKEDGTLWCYIPGISDVKRKEIAETLLADSVALYAVICEVAGMGDK